MGSSTKLICLKASLSTPTEQRRERSTTTTIEVGLTLDDEVPVDKTVQGLGDAAIDAMLIGHGVLAVVDVRQLKTTIEGLEVISNVDDANYVYYSVIPGPRRLGSSASIQEDFDTRMLKMLMMRCTYFGCVVTGGVCPWASERRCSTLHETRGFWKWGRCRKWGL